MNVEIKIHSKRYDKWFDDMIIFVSRVPCIGESIRVKNEKYKVVDVIHENNELPFIILDN